MAAYNPSAIVSRNQEDDVKGAEVTEDTSIDESEQPRNQEDDVKGAEVTEDRSIDESEQPRNQEDDVKGVEVTEEVLEDHKVEAEHETDKNELVEDILVMLNKLKDPYQLQEGQPESVDHLPSLTSI